MRIAIIFILITSFILSCKDTRTDSAIKWSEDIKMKIFEDVKVKNDSFSVDTSNTKVNYVSLFHKSIRTKKFGIQKSNGDVINSIFYSKNQNFELVHEFCPAYERGFEGIRYQGKFLGLYKLSFCNGKLQEEGFNFNENVGVKTQWNDSGDVVNKTDYGRLKALKGLTKIKYNP